MSRKIPIPIPISTIVFVAIVTACVFVSTLTSIGHEAQAQELVRDTISIFKARVIEVLEQEERQVLGTDVGGIFQKLSVEILEGPQEGERVIVENDYLNLQDGEMFYLRHVINDVDGIDYYSVADPYRLPVIYILIGAFVVLVIVFGGKQGARGIVALAISFVFIIYLLFPGVLHGYSPVWVSMGVASLIVVLGSYITHGFNRVTSSAVLGMIATILITGALAYVSIHYGRLTGFDSEEAVFLNLQTRGAIDFAGLLLGGMLIGLLGVLYDAAIGQAVAVDELHHVGPHLERSVIFRRAIRIGREHIGALVNTLAIAYVGASLPLLLLFYHSTAGTDILINQEIFAAEIVRALVGSIGLVLAVPITTAIAVSMLVHPRDRSLTSPASIATEREQVEHAGHAH